MRFTTAETKSKAIIDGVEITNDTLTGRGGLSLFARYLRNIHIFQQIDTFFGSMRRSRKGQPITEIFNGCSYGIFAQPYEIIVKSYKNKKNW